VTTSRRIHATYVLPLRRTSAGPIDELRDYLEDLGALVDEVIVVDGSPPDLFARHAAVLPAGVRHIPPAVPRGANGKVAGVVTGVAAARNDSVVIADDDVRYGPDSIREILDHLAEAELVRPQNRFDAMPWHARLDTARTLLNRVWTGDRLFPVGDFPGTLAVRRGFFIAIGAYDGDVLFENLELMRTVAAAGGRVRTSLGTYVDRRPPDTSHFWSQRVRQAYDDLAVPLRFAVLLALLPAGAVLAVSRRFGWLASGAAVSVALAEKGRRRAGGAGRFPFSCSLLAPVWLAERAVSCWLALACRARGGVRYAGRRILVSANSVETIRRRRLRSL